MRDRNRGRQRRQADKHAINEHITAKEVRVVGSEGEQLGVIPIAEALARAEEVGLDLVEVAAQADPPVCRILDYGKLKYREQKKAAEARKKSTTNVVKELRVRYSTDRHDLDTKIRRAKEFFKEGDKVRFQMRFRGREVVYRELGEAIFDEIIALLEEEAVVEERTRLLGNRMTLTFAPRNSKKEKT